MQALPVPIRPVLRRLARRLAVGLFLDVWPAWAAAGLLAAGLTAIVCRLFFPAAGPYLAWLLLAPIAALLPALVICTRRAYEPEQVVALADSLAGGHGVLLTLMENHDSPWAHSPIVEQASRFTLPRLRPWRRMAPVGAAVVFLLAALWLPQRLPARGDTLLADDIAADLATTVAGLKEQALVTPEEEEKLAEEIERIRRAADERIDASSWEAADAMRERVIAALSEKQDAVKWAEAALRRYGSALQDGAAGSVEGQAAAAELAEAIGKLAESGLLANAAPELQRLLKGGKLPADPRALRAVMDALSQHLADTSGKFGELARLGEGFGRFDPSEFPLEETIDGDGNPGRGAATRGRADAALTWGNESLPLDRFKSKPLPPGAARNPDDWAPLVEAPGAPTEAPMPGARAAARQYASSVGQTAWRRTLAPRHQSAVKKYFARQP